MVVTVKLTEYRDSEVRALADALQSAVMSPTLDRAGEIVPALSAMRDGVRAVIRAASNSSGPTFDIKDLPSEIRACWERAEHCLKVLFMMYDEEIPEGEKR